MNKIVILAAGQGKRMGAELPKVLVPIQGKPMIEYLIKAIKKSGMDKEPVIVVSPDNKDIIQKALRRYKCKYALQDKQLGTGHALSCAKKVIGDNKDHILCFYGDHPFIKAETIKRIARSHNGAITMMTTGVKDFKGWRKNFFHWGRVLRNHGHIKAIVEFKDADDQIKKIREVNPAIYCFQAKWLWKNIKKLKNDNAQAEYYLTDLIKQAFTQGIRVESFPIDPEEAMGINTKEELKIAKKLI
jgi:bifunctional UDP-N-acetylglucosamine pyrophosphorylase/glucosamine-1-phosphate N-acetyltransferase